MPSIKKNAKKKTKEPKKDLKKNKLDIKIVNLNNKTRKGEYIRFYDKINKKTTYYRYLKKNKIEDYKAYYKVNQKNKLRIDPNKIITKTTKKELKLLNKKQNDNALTKKEIAKKLKKKIEIETLKNTKKFTQKKIKEILDHYKKLSKKGLSYNQIIKQITKKTQQFDHTFEYKKGFNQNIELDNFLKKGVLNQETRRLLVQNTSGIARYMSYDIEIKGIARDMPSIGETMLAKVFINNQAHNKIMSILQNHDLTEITSNDPLLEDLKINANAFLKGTPVNGRITKIIIKMDLRTHAPIQKKLFKK